MNEQNKVWYSLRAAACVALPMLCAIVQMPGAAAQSSAPGSSSGQQGQQPTGTSPQGVNPTAPAPPPAVRPGVRGAPQLTGEPMFSVLERLWSRPTMDVHGMPGGFTGPGAKTVIPAKATAKISFRLVPGMQPDDIFAKYTAFVEQISPEGVTVDVSLIHSGEPIVVSTDNAYIRAATAAMSVVFGKETVFVRGGGSIPVVGDFVRELGIPAVLLGFGLPDDNLHAPNEKFHLPNFHRGIESIIRFLHLVGTGV